MRPDATSRSQKQTLHPRRIRILRKNLNIYSANANPRTVIRTLVPLVYTIGSNIRSFVRELSELQMPTGLRDLDGRQILTGQHSALWIL